MNKPTPDELVDDASGPRVTRRRTTRKWSPVTSTVQTSVAQTSATPATAAPPPFQMPPIPPSATGYGSEEWLRILAEQQEENNQKMNTIVELMTDMQGQLTSLQAKTEKFMMYVRDHCRVQNRFLRNNDPLLGGEIPRFPSGIVPPQVRLPAVVSRSSPTVMTAATTVTVPPETVATATTTSVPDTVMHAAATSNPAEGGNMI